MTMTDTKIGETAGLTVMTLSILLLIGGVAAYLAEQETSGSTWRIHRAFIGCVVAGGCGVLVVTPLAGCLEVWWTNRQILPDPPRFSYCEGARNAFCSAGSCLCRLCLS